MTVSIEEEELSRNGRFRNKRCSATTSRTAIFYFWIMILFIQVCLCSANHDSIAPSSWPLSRKLGSSSTVSFAAASPSPLASNNSDDKRIIHTECSKRRTGAYQLMQGL
ncbi:hypothetical protein POM88_015194 [Heracleum sosnowskyi]|uniref:Uncharacterized protein n=1 Tax=Heracleum sosnowskyi TaxID=360622 RepID=A0AAD8MVM5_9APIA|nr:hypothetical protein POM88_015194 [Heracleum sosnowskyi]